MLRRTGVNRHHEGATLEPYFERPGLQLYHGDVLQLLPQFERVAQNVQGSGNVVFFIAFLLALTPWMQIKTSSQEGQAFVAALAIIGGLVSGFVCSAMYRAAATIIRLLIIIARNGNGR